MSAEGLFHPQITFLLLESHHKFGFCHPPSSTLTPQLVPTTRPSILIMTILEDIANNKIETLHFENAPSDYFGSPKEFVEAMAKNTSIKTVFFEKDFIACLKGDDRAQVVSAVGKLPNVEKVELKDSLLMVGICVTNLVKNAKKLESISFEHCVMQGTEDDFNLLGDALKASTSVKEVTIGECHATDEEVDLKTVYSGLSDIKLNVSVANAA